MTSKDDWTQKLMLAGLAGVVLCVLWWALFYSRVIAFTGGSAHDFSQVLGCLIYSSAQCVIIKGISSLAGYWPYEPFFLWLSAGVFAVGAILRSAQDKVQDKAYDGAGAAASNRLPSMAQTPTAKTPTAKTASPVAPVPAAASWLVSAILANGQILKFDINQGAPCKIVGRDPNQADVVIADDSISRAHARIEWRDGDLWVADLNSTNGTRVGNRAVGLEPQRLYPSAKLHLGPVIFTISTA